MKVVCIGPNKTGTSSLNAAFAVLGYRPFHEVYTFNELVSKAVSENKPLFYYLNKYDVFSDIFLPIELQSKAPPILRIDNLSEFLNRIESDYPGVKFVFNTRDKASWIESRRKHVNRNKSSNSYQGDWTEYRPEDWASEYEAINTEISRYFEGRETDLLVFDVEAGEGWQKLCDFLELPIPEKEFPLANTSLSKSSLARFLSPWLPGDVKRFVKSRGSRE